MNTIALFDLDYTLLNTSSGLTYIKEALKQHRISPWVAVQIGIFNKLRILDFGQAHARLITHVAKQGQAEAISFFEEWVSRALFSRLAPKGRAKIEWHQKQGHRVVMVSASIEEIVKPVAKYLGLQQDYLCTHLKVYDDRYTGELDGPLCYGPGKVQWVKLWATQNKIDLSEITAYVYTDSASDVPLLELATYPIAVNPSRKLAKIARARGWTIERFY